MRNEKIAEKTSRSESRLRVVHGRAKKDYENRKSDLEIRIETFKANLNSGDQVDRQQKIQELQMYGRQLKELEEGWLNSTLRATMLNAEKAESGIGGGSEQRILGAPVTSNSNNVFSGSDSRSSKYMTKIAGYISKYKERSLLLEGCFYEMILPGAFDKSLHNDIRCTFNHSYDQLLGRTKSGTLRLDSDTIGLRFVCDLLPTSLHKFIGETIRSGNVSGCSFMFYVISDRYVFKKGEADLRIIEEVDLLELGPVCLPAYPSTTCFVICADRSNTNADYDRSWIDDLDEIDDADIIYRLKKDQPVSPERQLEIKRKFRMASYQIARLKQSIAGEKR